MPAGERRVVNEVDVDGVASFGEVRRLPRRVIDIGLQADTTAVAQVALPLRCPKCNRQFAVGTAFCGDDGSSLVQA